MKLPAQPSCFSLTPNLQQLRMLYQFKVRRNIYLPLVKMYVDFN